MRFRIVVAWMLLCGPAGPALAQAAEPPDPASQPPAASPPPPAAPPAEVIPLSLHEAIALGIENNTDVQLVRYDPPIAEYDHSAAWGLHDPTLFTDALYESRDTPIASSLQQSDSLIEREWSGNLGIRGLLPRVGWQYLVGYNTSSLETSSSIAELGKEYRPAVIASLTAPLLKGAWWGAAWTQVELTGIQSGIALEQFRQRLMDIVGGPPGVPLEQNPGIEFAYWTLAARKQELEVANKSLQTARALLQQTKAQYDVGVVSRVEVVEAEAGVADREFRQITFENLYRNAQDELIDRVYGPRLTPTSRLEIEPTDRPESYVSFAVDPELSMQRALERRPELTIAMQQVEQGEIGLKFAKNERLPQVDLVGGYGYQGLAGREPRCFQLPGAPPCTPSQPDVPRHYMDADDTFFSGDGHVNWSGGALLSIPIPNTTARSNVAISELELRRALTNVRRTEQEIVKDVRDAVRNLASALQGVEAAERFVAASAEQLRAERIRLEHGESTPFDVLLREEDLVTAESQRITALRIYHGSVTALDRAQGTLLEDRGIVLEDALPLR
jgi:outer membrane protein TolC